MPRQKPTLRAPRVTCNRQGCRRWRFAHIPGLWTPDPMLCAEHQHPKVTPDA